MIQQHVRDRYKKTNFKKPDSYAEIIDKELNVFSKKAKHLLGKDYHFSYKFQYFTDLYKEYGNSVKILNHIEINVGIDRFIEIMEYFSKDNIYSYDFIKYMRDNSLIIPSITEEVNKEIVDVKEMKKNLTLNIIMFIFNISGTFAWMWLIYNETFNFWFSFVCFLLTFYSLVMTFDKLTNHKVVKTINK